MEVKMHDAAKFQDKMFTSHKKEKWLCHAYAYALHHMTI